MYSKFKISENQQVKSAHFLLRLSLYIHIYMYIYPIKSCIFITLQIHMQELKSFSYQTKISRTHI